MQTSYIAPAPWTLNGNGIVILYRFPSTFIQEYGFLDDFQQKGYKTGIGAVVLMDYKDSGVGPYRELLFLPGLFDVNGKLAFSISKIYVSTYDSARSGKRNWGIPKELADFKVETEADGSRIWKVRTDGTTFFEAIVKPKGLTFPLTSRLVPLTQIIQKGKKHFLLTRPKVSGMAKIASLQKAFSDPTYFPPVHQLKPLITLYLKDFVMKFPVAQQFGELSQEERQQKAFTK